MARIKKKLLQRTLSVYIIFSLVVISLTTPVFYFVTEKLYLEDADEALLIHKREFDRYFFPKFKKSDIVPWNKFNRDKKIEDNLPYIVKDTFLFKTYYDTLTPEMEPYRVLLSPIKIEGDLFTLSIRINLVEQEDLIKSTLLLFFLTISVLLTGLFFITRYLSRKMWKPFFDTLSVIEKFEVDKTTEPIFTQSDTEEFERLNTAIKSLILKNTIIFNSQKEFIENASHELQTPLAIFQSNIDMLIQRSDVSNEQSVILAKLGNSASRMNRLNKNLLLLSKIDTQLYNETSNCAVKELIEKNLSFFEEQAQSKNIIITLDFGKDLIVKTNHTLLEILLSNLFINAIQHNIPNGTIKIIVADNLISFSNTSTSGSLDGNKLFNRFSKASSTSSGNGLGLAIIKKIADWNKWKISYSFENNLHIFSLEV